MQTIGSAHRMCICAFSKTYGTFPRTAEITSHSDESFAATKSMIGFCVPKSVAISQNITTLQVEYRAEAIPIIADLILERDIASNHLLASRQICMINNTIELEVQICSFTTGSESIPDQLSPQSRKAFPMPFPDALTCQDLVNSKPDSSRLGGTC